MNRIVTVGSIQDDGADEARTASLAMPVEHPSAEPAEPNEFVGQPVAAEPGEAPTAAAETAEAATAEPGEAPPASAESAERSELIAKPRVRVDATPGPSELDIPDFRPRRRGRAVFALFGVAAAVALAGGAWLRLAKRGEQPAARAPVAAPERAPERAPAPPTPAPAPAPAPSPVATVTNVSATAPAATVEPAAAESAEKASGAVTVTVKVVPEDAVIFRAGKRLGAGVVEVSVERKVKQRLTALLDGYTPSNIVIDGSRDSVTIILRRAPKPRPAPPPESDTPSTDAPSSDATATAPTATAAPTATPAPTTESAPAAADVSSPPSP